MNRNALPRRLSCYCDLLVAYLDSLSEITKAVAVPAATGAATFASVTAGAPFMAIGAIVLILRAALDLKNNADTDKTLDQLKDNLCQIDVNKEFVSKVIADFTDGKLDNEQIAQLTRKNALPLLQLFQQGNTTAENLRDAKTQISEIQAFLKNKDFRDASAHQELLDAIENSNSALNPSLQKIDDLFANAIDQFLSKVPETLQPQFEELRDELRHLATKKDLVKLRGEIARDTRDTVSKQGEKQLEALGEVQKGVELLLSRPEQIQVPDDPQRFAPSRILRHSPKNLFGREPWLDELDEVWTKQPNTHIYSLIAWGGSGKTSLVAHWVAQRLAAKGWPGVERYFDWSFYSQGAREQSQNSADLFIDQALQFFDDPDPKQGSPWERGERLAHLIQKQRTLLILDGLEPLQFPPESKQAGELKDQALTALLQTLAFSNPGLCLLTSREEVTNLASFHGGTVTEKKLDHLPLPAAISLLQHLEINGTEAEMEAVWQSVGGHALTLSLLGRFLADAHGKDLRKWKDLKFEEADRETQGRTAMKVLTAYEHWLQSGGPDQQRDLAVLRLTGLFDRPADPGCLKALRAEPAIPGLTETIVSLQDYQWRKALTDLESLDLLTLSGEDENQLTLDAHPLVREYFATQLRDHHSEAFRAAHSRLFDHLCETTEHQPDTLQGLQPLYQAVTHGCLAHRHQEACRDIYRDRILRGTGNWGYYSRKQLGAIGSDLSAIEPLFEHTWFQPSQKLTAHDQAWLLTDASYCLGAKGRFAESIQACRVGLKRKIELGDWLNAAITASNLGVLQENIGSLSDSLTTGYKSIEYAKKANHWGQEVINLTITSSAIQKYSSKNHSHASEKQNDEALSLLEKAESLQATHAPEIPLLFSLSGSIYCEYLLRASESRVWRSSPDLLENLEEHQVAITEAIRRATQTLEWAKQFDLPLLTLANDHLTLARAEFYQALFAYPVRPLPIPEEPDSWPNHLENALSILRKANTLDHLPKALLTTAHFHAVTGDPEEAERYLAEAQLIAERGPMPLHLADVHLHRARLFQNKSELQKAAHLIEKHHYGRRFDELAHAQADSEHW